MLSCYQEVHVHILLNRDGEELAKRKGRKKFYLIKKKTITVLDGVEHRQLHVCIYAELQTEVLVL